MSEAGYSGTPLAKKLGVKAGARLALLGAPAGFETKLTGLPSDVRPVRDPRGKGPFDVICLFARDSKELERRLPTALARLDQNGGLWIAWPKKSSGVATDLADGVVRSTGLATGLVDNKVCAVDATWSGLRFVVRVADRTRRKQA